MKKIYLFVFLSLLLIGFVNAEKEICIDFDEPSEPMNLEVISSGKNIILSWDAATDIPDCSGIDYYVISRGGNQIENTSFLSYEDENVDYGTYSYSVYAVDKVSHNSGLAIKNDVVLSEPTDDGGDTTVSGGGGGTSYICIETWQCSDWSVCVDERQTRTCTDTNKCGTTKLRPITQKDCSIEEAGGAEESILETTEEGFFSAITGAVVGTLGTGGTIGVFVFILGAIGAFVFVKVKRRKNKVINSQ